MAECSNGGTQPIKIKMHYYSDHFTEHVKMLSNLFTLTRPEHSQSSFTLWHLCDLEKDQGNQNCYISVTAKRSNRASVRLY